MAFDPDDLPEDSPVLMGILNATPDSFSDGGTICSVEDAIAAAEIMAEDGARILDVGGESTRPGAAPVPAEEELRRVLPIVEVLAERLPEIPISIDTTKAAVARACLAAGARIVNDVSALRADADMVKVVRDAGAAVVLMHMQGTPQTMQKNPEYHDVVKEVGDFLYERARWAESQGIRKDRIFIDPGIGFGKTTEHNLTLLRNLDKLKKIGPLMVGLSRKAFLGRILGGETTPLPPAERGEATIAAHLWCAPHARILRVHDVRSAARALTIWHAVSKPN